jgi:hypothetical protein
MAYPNIKGSKKMGEPRYTFWMIHPSRRYISYVALLFSIIDVDPFSFEEANAIQVWCNSMFEKNNSILKNDAWDIVLRPMGKSMIDSRWLYKIKHEKNGSIERYKSKFIVGGFS